MYYYVYIVKCSDGSYYTGVTNNLQRRISEHDAGIDIECYTFKRRPVELVYSAYFFDVRYAIDREKQIKRWSRKKKEALIAENITSLHEHAKCKNETSHVFHKDQAMNSDQA